jgi:hypothetical protein
MMPHASSGLHSHQMKPLDLGLSASRTVRNKFLYRFPSLWNSVIATENRVRQVRRKMEEQKRGKRRTKEKRVSGLSWAWCHTPIIPGGQAILGYIVRPCPPCPQKKQGTKKHQYRTYRYKNNEELMQTAYAICINLEK